MLRLARLVRGRDGCPARQRYLQAHLGEDERDLMPTLAGYAPVADWVAAGEPAAERAGGDGGQAAP